jgi:HEAT repeat protein
LNEDKPSLEALLTELHSANKRVRTKTVRALGATGDIEVVEPLIEALEDHAESVRLQGVKTLGRFRDKRAMGPLIARLDDEDPTVRRQTAVALRKYGVELRQPLMDAYRKGSSRLRMASLGILANFRSPAITELLIAALDDADCHMAWSAAAFLAKRKDKKTTARLIEELQKPGADRAYFARILGQIGDRAAFDPLQAHLEDECPAVRLTVVEALRKIDNARAIDLFYDLLGDPSDPAQTPLVEKPGGTRPDGCPSVSGSLRAAHEPGNPATGPRPHPT